MNTWIRSTTASIALALAGTLLAQQANAGCSAQDTLSAALRPALYLQGGDGPGSLLRVSDDDSGVIVGLWKFTFTAKGNSPPGPRWRPDRCRLCYLAR